MKLTSNAEATGNTIKFLTETLKALIPPRSLRAENVST